MTGRHLVSALLALGLATGRAQAQSGLGFAPLDTMTPPPALTTIVSVRARGQSLRDAIDDVVRQARVSVAFAPQLAALDQRVGASVESVPAARAIMLLLRGTGLRAAAASDGAIVITAAPPSRDNTVKRVLRGTVTENGTAVAGVHVALAGTRFEALTDDRGRFSFGVVPSGTYALRAQRMGFAAVAQTVAVGDEPAQPITVVMTPVAVPVQAVIVTPGYVGVMQAGLGAGQMLTREQIETVPQLGEDVYRSISRLPGVSSDDYSARFTVRGEPVDRMYVTLDGLPLVEPYHLRDLGSALSIVDLAALGEAEMMTGGPSAEYGQQLAGVFRLHTIEPRRDRARASAGVSLTNVRAMSQGGFADGRGGWLVSGRRGFLDLAFKFAGIDDSISPGYNDIFAKAVWDLPRGGRVAVHALHAGDRVRYIGTGEPSLDSHYSSDYGWLTVQSAVAPSVRQSSVFWASHLDWYRSGQEMGNTYRALDLADDRALRSFGVRTDWSADVGDHLALKWGAEATRASARFDYRRVHDFSVPSSGVLVRTIDSLRAHLTPSGSQLSGYAAARVRPVSSLTLEAGARWDRLTTPEESYTSPRLNAAWQPASFTTIRAALGVHARSEPLFALQVENGARTYQRAERTRQASIGVDQVLWNGLVARVEAYSNDTRDLQARWINASARIDPLSEIGTRLALLAPTRARARGMELTLSREGGRRMDWTASYVASSSEQELDSRWLPRAGDQPHALRADWSVHPESNAWRLTLSGTTHSGWPLTPEVARVDTLRDGTSIWVTRASGDLYSRRANRYARLDARWTRWIDTGSGRVSVFVDVFNALNNSNVRDLYYDRVTGISQFKLAESSRYGLPRIPSFGINWEF